MALNEKERQWYVEAIQRLDPNQQVVAVDTANNILTYAASIRCDESRQRKGTDEELVRALALCTLASAVSGYTPDSFYIEKYYQHGHPSSKRDEVDLVIFDSDELPFAMWEFKPPAEYDKDAHQYIRYQLFGNCPACRGPKASRVCNHPADWR